MKTIILTRLVLMTWLYLQTRSDILLDENEIRIRIRIKIRIRIRIRKERRGKERENHNIFVSQLEYHYKKMVLFNFFLHT